MIQNLSIPTYLYVSPKAAEVYQIYGPRLKERVNILMSELNEQMNIIGDNPITVVFNTNSKQVDFMSTVFNLNDYEMLLNTLPWVFSINASKGLSPKYFDYAVKTWIKVIDEMIPEAYRAEIKRVYQWMILIKPELEEAIKSDHRLCDYPYEPEWCDLKDTFRDYLLSNHVAHALDLANSIVTDITSFQNFFHKVLTYTMCDVCRLWRLKKITATKESLVTSSVIQILSSLYTSNEIPSCMQKRTVH